MGANGHIALILCSLGILAAPASAQGWHLASRSSDNLLELTFSEGDRIVYRFDCEPSDLAVSQIGVTKLLDIQTNTPIGDGPGSTITPGAALMALATDKVQPNMVAATAAANAAGGWDMTIRLPKDDPAFLSLPRAGMLSLFTTGFTRAVMLDKADRTLLADFVKQCRSS